ncbi:hypothetical protein XELAEV_18023272mg [Xenopus laevis]|uniref:C2 domain-containing protein n=1 Tax=Xenopus laevis TaxID=8355 RepID=A0A974D6I6_XENLA|nr:hypothetical protein XELAEV_18023272mg [Xenopus laevis]
MPEHNQSSFRLQSMSQFISENYILFLLLGYFLGSIHFKIGYVIIGILIWKRYRYWKTSRCPSGMKTEDNAKEQKEAPQKLLREHFERNKSLNVIVESMWPYVTTVLENTLRQKIQPKIRSASKYLSSFRFINVDFGNKAPQVTALRAHADPKKKQIMLDLEISYNTEVKVDVGFTAETAIAGVKSVKLEGTLRIILAPLMEEVPLAGSLTFYFPHRPVLELRWTGLSHLLNIPGLHTMSDKKIVDKIAHFLVSPNHLSQPLTSKFDVNELHFIEPKNVLRIHVIEAKNLIATDILMKSSDPYVVIHGGQTTEQTRVIHKNLNPQWNEPFEILYSDLPGQEIEFHLFHKNRAIHHREIDQSLGKCTISTEEVPETKCLDKWIQLEKAKSGQLHIRIERLNLLSDPTKLEEVLKENMQTQLEWNKDISSAVLYAVIEKARGLPMIQVRKDKLKPLAVVLASVGDSVKKTGSKVNNGEAEWKKRFQFLIRNPLNEELKLKVLNEIGAPLGCVTVPLSRLVAAMDMTMEDWLPLELTEQNCDIRVKLQLRILTPYSMKPEQQESTRITQKKTKASLPRKRKSRTKVPKQ